MQRTFDFTTSDGTAGFRLHRFEVLNWGTFHKHIWDICPEGRDSLLTGDIGSGKSTLVDGLTSLLVPPQRIVYNKAAGAESRERSLNSYVYGYFKSEKDEDTLTPRSIALRDNQSYSVLLASFFNEGFHETVALAQVFWGRDNRQPPERFYVVANKDMTISEGFARFGRDVADLKKRLNRERGVKVFDSFIQYSTEFRRRMGIESQQAMDLFYQTVSMKSVGNLTDFVRRHMLEEPPVQERIDGICKHFDDLTRAHEAVLKARRQVEMLSPIETEAVRYRAIEEGVVKLKKDREALYAFFASKKIALLKRRIGLRKTAHDKMSASIEGLRLRMEEERAEQRRVERSISENGGRRLEELKEEMERLTSLRRRIQAKEDAFRGWCKELNLSFPDNESAFIDIRNLANDGRRSILHQKEEIQNRQVEERVKQKGIDDERAGVEREIESLKGRRSNIPRDNLMIRAAMATAIGVSEDLLPFAGELLRIKETEARWEGAAERIMRNFALSILVRDEDYNAVSSYVDETSLKGRVVYLRTSSDRGAPIRPSGHDSLLKKIEIRPETTFYDWLERELSRRFDLICCGDLEGFRRVGSAVTVSGQIKTGGVRHEKDDRYRIDDRSRYVLGWNNREKIRALQAEANGLGGQSREIQEELKRLGRNLRKADAAWERLQGIISVEEYSEINWQPLALRISALEEEKKKIQSGSDILLTLQTRLEQVLRDIQKDEETRGKRQSDLGRLEEGISQDRRMLDTSEETLAAYGEGSRDERFSELFEMQPNALGVRKITIETCDNCQTQMRSWLQKRIENEEEKARRSAGHIVRAMQEYKGLYPNETREVDASLESIDEFIGMLDRLRREDLPRHEQRFKEMLNQGTIQSIALFHSKLNVELEGILEKVAIINRSLSSIDYNDGTYIALIADPSRDVEIRDFRHDLKACMGDTLAGGGEDEEYTEKKFLQVKALIDRFNGRTGLTDQDHRWTRKVTDVRNWLIFSVSEKWRADEKEKEFYSDTAGKSGGQKEKLAYTILASALAYQFGLKFGEVKSRSFRFVMIDEAFGRGSDESTRYALELFSRLNLQMLIVTPLQKINIIENYVSAVHYIHNEGGRNSMVRNLTIEEYMEEKAAYEGTAS